MSRRRGGLTPDEEALWRLAMRDVAPLRAARVRRLRRIAAEALAAPAPPVPEPPASKQPVSNSPVSNLPVSNLPAPAASASPARAARAVAPAPRPPPLAPIDRHERRAVQRGTRTLEGRIDLHGLTQDEALWALRGFLARSQAQGRRLVLVITGKGGPQDRVRENRTRGSDDGHALSFADRGVLRRVVPHWLSAPEWRGLVVGFEPAHPSHGGSGALYVRLRRARDAGLPGGS